MTLIERNYHTIAEMMSGWDNRLRAQLSLVWGPRGMAAGLGVALLVALLARLTPLLERSILVILSLATGLVGLLVALVAVWIWPHRPLWLARRFDRVFGLRERLSTAVELGEGRLPVESRALARLQIGEAVASARQVNPASGLPLKLPIRDVAVLGGVLVALAVTLLLPNPQANVLAERRAVEAAISDELERLEALRQEMLDDPSLGEAHRQAIVDTLDTAIVSLERPDLSRQEAVAELSAAEEQLRELSQQAADRARQTGQPLQNSGALFNTPSVSEGLGEALSQGDFEQASEQIEQLLDADGPPLTQEELDALQQELSQAADALGESNPELSQQLQQAANSLQQGDQAAARQQLSQASQQLSQQGQQISQEQASAQSAQQAASQLGQGQQSVAEAGGGQSGQGQGQGQGQQGQGQATGQGQGAGEGGTQNAGGGGAGAGAGLGEAQGSPITGSMPTNNSPERDDVREFEPVFAPQSPGGEGGPVVEVPGGEGAGEVPVAEGDFVENPAGEAQVPYSDVFSDYADAANEALEGEYVPLGLRDLVRDYFSSLDPDR